MTRLSQPFKPVTLLVVGGLLLAMTTLLVMASVGDERSLAVAEKIILPTEADSSGPTLSDQNAAAAAGVTATSQPRVSPEVPATLEVSRTRSPETRTLPPTESANPSAVPVDKDPTPSPTPQPASSNPDMQPDEWRRVRIPEPEISFDVPALWHRLGDKWLWSPDGTDTLRVGFEWAERKSPADMLPSSFSVTAETTLNLGWTEASSFQLALLQDADVIAAEKHVIIQLSDELIGDFFARGPSVSELASIDTVLSQLLSTFTYRAAPDGPIEVSIGFLNALMQGPDGDQGAEFLSDSLQGASPLALLGVQEVFHSFGVFLLPAVDGRVRVQAALNYPGARVEQRVLSLIKQDEGWRIDEVLSGS